jgi:hypothetical protein
LIFGLRIFDEDKKHPTEPLSERSPDRGGRRLNFDLWLLVFGFNHPVDPVHPV